MSCKLTLDDFFLAIALIHLSIVQRREFYLRTSARLTEPTSLEKSTYWVKPR